MKKTIALVFVFSLGYLASALAPSYHSTPGQTDVSNTPSYAYHGTTPSVDFSVVPFR